MGTRPRGVSRIPAATGNPRARSGGRQGPHVACAGGLSPPQRRVRGVCRARTSHHGGSPPAGAHPSRPTSRPPEAATVDHGSLAWRSRPANKGRDGGGESERTGAARRWSCSWTIRWMSAPRAPRFCRGQPLWAITSSPYGQCPGASCGQAADGQRPCGPGPGGAAHRVGRYAMGRGSVMVCTTLRPLRAWPSTRGASHCGQLSNAQG